jgi:hypothetical protein
MAHLYINIQFFIFISSKVTAWDRVFLEKLTVTQLLEKFPAFYGTRRLIAVLMSLVVPYSQPDSSSSIIRALFP